MYSVHESVIIKPNQLYIHSSWVDKNFRYEGTIKNIKEHYINRAVQRFGKVRSLYIGFIDNRAYNNLLIRGSLIMCYIRNTLLMNCYIINVIKDSSGNIISLDVSIYNDESIISEDYVYSINLNNVYSMLITEEAFLIQKL